MFRTEYHVLNSNKKIKEGMCSIFIKSSNKVIARGNYKNNSLSGTWMFFDFEGELEQRYNFDQNMLKFNNLNLIRNYINYQFSVKIEPQDSVTVPIKIGGVFYSCSFVLQPNHEIADYMTRNNIEKSKINNYLSIDENGNLTSWKSTVEADGKVFTNSIIDLPDFFKIFIPARINHKNIASTLIFSIVIRASSNNRSFTIN